MRAISTILDVSLCLLLVSASALTLAGTPAREDETATVSPDSADETADLLATSTASVTYRSASPASAERSATSAAAPRNRTVHDTLAGLLASAVEAKASRNATSFVRAVTARVGRTLRKAGIRAQVVARRSPREPTSTKSTSTESTSAEPASTESISVMSDDAARQDSTRVVAGPAPPPDADVSAAAFAVRGVTISVRTWSR